MGWIFTIAASTGELVMIWGLKKKSLLLLASCWIVGVIVSGFFLRHALQILDSSTVYPFWVSIGAVGSLLMGAKMHGEYLSRQQYGFAGLLAIGCSLLFISGG